MSVPDAQKRPQGSGMIFMERYDYLQAVKNDVIYWLNEHEDFKTEFADDNRGEIEQELYDTLFIEDSVTGNGSGSYFFNSWKAEEALCHNIELLCEACAELGVYDNILERGAEVCDVTIRCYLLPQAITLALDELTEEHE